MTDIRDPLTRISAEPARTAHRLMLAGSSSCGLKASNNTGKIFAIRLHSDSGDYLFSWIANKAHLTFYIRNPAMKTKSTLRQSVGRLPLESSTNDSGEIKLRVVTGEDARVILDWLQAERAW